MPNVERTAPFEVFQFQSGAIQRKTVLNLNKAYQDVSIPKWCDSKFSDSIGIIAPIIGFNSKVVRFKAAGCKSRIDSKICFNSKVVRFKVNVRQEEVEAARFQFQSGAIQSKDRRNDEPPPNRSFNSKVVRFKVSTFNR